MKIGIRIALITMVALFFSFMSYSVVKNGTNDYEKQIESLQDQLRIANSQKEYWERAYKHPNRIHIETHLPDLTSMQINIDFPEDRVLTHFERILIRDEIMEIVYSESFKAGFELEKELFQEQREMESLNNEYLDKYYRAETDEERKEIKSEALEKADAWEEEKRERYENFFKMRITRIPVE